MYLGAIPCCMRLQSLDGVCLARHWIPNAWTSFGSVCTIHGVCHIHVVDVCTELAVSILRNMLKLPYSVLCETTYHFLDLKNSAKKAATRSKFQCSVLFTGFRTSIRVRQYANKHLRELMHLLKKTTCYICLMSFYAHSRIYAML